MNKIFTLALMALMAASCSHDKSNSGDIPIKDGDKVIALAKVPEITVSSGGKILGVRSADNPESRPIKSRESGDLKSLANVEVNYSIVSHIADNAKDFAMHLSVHVCDTTDIETVIPLKAMYFCAAANFEMVITDDPNDDEELEINFGDHGQLVRTYFVDGQTVNINVGYALNGIMIKTTGINERVLRYLRNQYDDGLTLDVWNYMNFTECQYDAEGNISRFEGPKDSFVDFSTFKNMMDKSTIAFTSTPELYVNSIMPAEGGGKPNPMDCIMNPFNPGAFDQSEVGGYLNGSPYNVLWLRN